MKWISGYWPNEEIRYLCTDGERIWTAYYHGDGKFMADDGIYFDVLYWMPLPKLTGLKTLYNDEGNNE